MAKNEFIPGIGSCYVYDTDGTHLLTIGSDGGVMVTVTETGAVFEIIMNNVVAEEIVWDYTGNKIFVGFSSFPPDPDGEDLSINLTVGGRHDVTGAQIQVIEASAVYDLTTLNLSPGTYTITVKAKADNYKDSLHSNAVSYTVEGLEKLAYTLNGDGASYSVTGIGTATDTDIVIPEIYNGLPVTSIGSEAFYWYSSLTRITIPDSVTSIGASAFRGCSSLTSITIPDSVTSIDEQAFSYCNNLTTIYCEAASQPSGWSSDWLNGCNATVVWGYTGG